jgi:hypothetical protein
VEADELRARLKRLRDLATHDGAHGARLTGKLREQARRLTPGDDPADLSPAALVAGLIFADLDAGRETEFLAAVAGLAPERSAGVDLVLRALELAGAA